MKRTGGERQLVSRRVRLVQGRNLLQHAAVARECWATLTAQRVVNFSIRIRQGAAASAGGDRARGRTWQWNSQVPGLSATRSRLRVVPLRARTLSVCRP